MMDWEKGLIESIGKNQGSIRYSGKRRKASKLNEASTEPHLQHGHFIKEIMKEMDSKTYGEKTRQFVQFWLTKEDVAEVGASATLIILNNDAAQMTAIMTTLCNVSTATGTWLKSAFTVCETPIIISKGFRVRFKETGVGCIVPEWAEAPTDDNILSAIEQEELPGTVVILPICNGKVDLVRSQLEDLSPETVLFLSKIRKLQIVDKMDDPLYLKDLNLRVTRSDPLSAMESRVCKFFKVTLRVAWPPAKVTDRISYLVFQRRFPVTPSIQERQEIHEWVITLAFPRERFERADHRCSQIFSIVMTGLITGFPFLLNADFVFTSLKEIQLGNAWNAGILSCVPKAFQVAFEIMLQKPDSKLLEADGLTRIWNGQWQEDHLTRTQGFYTQEDTLALSQYRFLPSLDVEELNSEWDVEPHQVPNLQHLEKLRREIFQRLATDSQIIRSSSNIGSPSEYTEGLEESTWFSAKACVQVKRAFYEILISAAESNHPAPPVVLELPEGARRPTAKFVLVTFKTQVHHDSVLSALGVPKMTSDQYESFLMESQWLVNLPDKIYIQLLWFFAYDKNLLGESESRLNTSVRETFRILKVRGQMSPVELVTFSEVSLGLGTGTELFYTSSEEDAHWILEWVNEFSLWDSAKFMPAETSEALLEANYSEMLMAWVKRHGSLSHMSPHKYSERLIEKLQFITVKSEYQTCNPIDHAESTELFSILVMQFLYSGICENLLSWEATVDKIRSLEQVYIVDQKSSMQLCVNQKLREEGRVLLPPTASRWSRLFPSPLGDEHHLIVLSDKYLDSQCPVVKDIVTSSRGPDTMFEFLKQCFNATDVA